MSDTARFLVEHFDRLVEAPGGIAKLRALIVELGIQGKLVAQNRNDEPVYRLLSRVRKARAKLITAGEAQPLKELPEIATEDLPFEIPDSWQWVHLAEVTAYIQRGKSPIYEPGSAQFVLNQKCIQWDGLHFEYAKEVSGASLDRYEPVRFLRSGDILWNSTGTGTIGRCLVFRPIATMPKRIAVDGHVTMVRTIDVEPDYIQRWLMSPLVYGVIEQRASGATNQVELTSTMATKQLISLPPLAEQRRIVSKLAELMGLCDAFESARRKREAVRTRLRISALHRLTASVSDSKAAAFVLRYLPHLTAIPEDLTSFRQSVLQLAVQGRLLPQGIDRDCSIAEPNSEAFSVPPSWRWESISAIGKTQTGSTPPTAERQHYSGKIPFIKPAAINVKHGEVVYTGEGLTTSGATESTLVEPGTILMVCIGGSIGKAAVVDRPVCFNQQINSVTPHREVDSQYLLLAMRSPYFLRCVLDTAAQGTLPIISKGKWERLQIPLPPLDEQRRIVAKVNEHMAALDGLEAALSAARATAESLLAATIARLHVS